MREILGILPNYQYKAVMLLLTGRGPEKDWIGIPQMKDLNLYFSVPCSTLESNVCAHERLKLYYERSQHHMSESEFRQMMAFSYTSQPWNCAKSALETHISV